MIQKTIRKGKRKMSEYVIETSGLTKKFGSFTALDNVNLRVKKGDIYGLVGDNGAGKTTLMRLISGMLYPDSGFISLFDADQKKELEKQRRRTGAIIENPGFYPQLSVEKNLEYYRIQKGIPDKKAVDEMLELVGLSDKRKKPGKALSMGMKQRLGLAVALMGEPELLVLDEPINGLDPSGIMEIRSLLLKLNREKRITILISSHILPELEHLATRYGFLEKGHLAVQISAEELKERCSSYVEIKVSDCEKYAVLLEKEFHHEAYQVLPENVIHIMNPQYEISRYSQAAAENGIVVLGLSMQHISLEDYYMKVKAEVKA